MKSEVSFLLRRRYIYTSAITTQFVCVTIIDWEFLFWHPESYDDPQACPAHPTPPIYSYLRRYE